MIKLASPNSSTAACSLLRLCQSCKPLAAVAQASFGRRGCAVLMELSGKVILTRDGIDIFKSLLVDDPVVKMAVSHILCFATARGDGSKTCFVLLNRMLFVINDSFFSDNETIFHQPVAASRSRAVKKLQNWRLVVLPTLLRLTVIQYCFATSVRSSKYCEVISSFLKSFLLLRFPQLVANRLFDLLKKLLQLNRIKDSLLKNVHHCLEQKMNLLFQVYRCPLRLSQVIEGFILSRDFKIEPREILMTKRKVILWSVTLEADADEIVVPVIVTRDEDTFLNTNFYKSLRINKIAEMLERQNIQVIVSSVLFPDWAVVACKRHSIAVVDMLCEEEFNFLSEHLGISPIVAVAELLDFKNHCEIEVGAIHLGSSRYVHLKTKTRQVVVAGPTVTQCNQYCQALVASLKALQNWSQESKNFTCESDVLVKFSANDTSLAGNSQDILIWCPSEGYIQCASHLALKYCTELRAPSGLTNDNLLSEIVLEILRISYSHTVAMPNRNFLSYLLEYCRQLQDSDLRENLAASAVTECRLENPFQFFAALNSTTQLAESILRIDSIIDVKREPKTNNIPFKH